MGFGVDVGLRSLDCGMLISYDVVLFVLSAFS